MAMSFVYQCIVIAFLALFLIGLMGAMLWNALRPANGWKRELKATRQANAERQPLVDRLEQVAR
jgi:hypothetical protein